MSAKGGSFFSRGKKGPAAAPADNPEQSEENELKEGLEQELSSVERQVHRLFEGSRPNKRRWDREGTRAQVSKWRRLREERALPKLGAANTRPVKTMIAKPRARMGASRKQQREGQAVATQNESGSLNRKDVWSPYKTLEKWLE